MLAALTAPAYPQTTFQPAVTMGVGSGPAAVAVGDLNRDGVPDLIVANTGTDNMSIFYGVGGGRFGPRTDIGTGVAPHGVGVGDFNGDGILDIVVVNTGSDSVSVFLGDGRGGFSRADYGTSNAPFSVAVGDLNGDGVPDLVVGHATVPVLSVLLGAGNGAFGPRTDFASGIALSVAVGDVNGDGRLDVVAGNVASSSVSVLLGDGAGRLGGATEVPVGAGTGRFAVLADVDGDGVLDIVVATSAGNAVSVLRGIGDGRFASAALFPTGSSPRGVTVADLNGDGKLDLAVPALADGVVSILLGTGTGTFGAPTSLPAGAAPFFVATAELSGDGRQDVVVVNGGGSSLSVFLNATAFPSSVDFTGDGRADVVVHDLQTGNWFVGRSTGGSFAVEPWVSNFGNRGADVEETFAADFTGDGRTDVAVHDLPSGNWFVGASTGTNFAVTQWVRGFGTRGRTVEEVFVADFTGDGRADVAIHDRQSGEWFVGRSTGSSFTIERWATRFGNRPDVEETFVGDFTGDGKVDVAIHDRQTGEWFVGRSTGAAFVVERWVSGFGNRGAAFEEAFVGDFTGDGKVDVAIHDRQSGDWFVGRSTGSRFTIEPWVRGFGNQGATVEEAFVGDFTGDGKADVAIQNRRTGDWFVGRSTGSSFEIEAWVSGFGNRGEREEIFVADFTGDGRIDVGLHDRQTGQWFVGRSTGASFAVEIWATNFGNRGAGFEEALAGPRR